MSISRSARITRTAISPRFAIRTFPNTSRTSPPSSNRTTETPRASCAAGLRARTVQPASSGCGWEAPRPPPPRAAPPVQPLWPRPPRAWGRARSSKRDVPVLARRALRTLGPDHIQGLYEVGAGLARVYHVVDVAHLGGDPRVVEPLLVSGDELLALSVGVFGLVELAPEDDIDRGGGAPGRALPPGPRDVDVRPDVLGVHDVVGPAVGFARDNGHLRNARLGEGVEELRPVADDPTPLLVGTRQKPRHVHESNERDVESVAEAHEPRTLDARVYVERPSQNHRLVPDDPDGVPVEPPEAHHQVLRPALLHLVEF